MALVEPLGYIDFLALELSARGVITDSGGVQEDVILQVRASRFARTWSVSLPFSRDRTDDWSDLDALEQIPKLLDRSKPTMPIAEWDGRHRDAPSKSSSIRSDRRR